MFFYYDEIQHYIHRPIMLHVWNRVSFKTSVSSDKLVKLGEISHFKGASKYKADNTLFCSGLFFF